MVMTEREYDDPSVRQLAVFLQNRVGQLREVLKVLDAANVEVQALTVADSADFAVVRLVADRHDAAARALKDAEFAHTESVVLAAEVPEGRGGLLAVCRALIQGEVNIHACYPMHTRPTGHPVVVFHVDNVHAATDVMKRNGFRLLDEKDFGSKA
jgi:hypothetical protein